VFNQPVSSAAGGLISSVVPKALRGRIGGWSQAGMLGGGILTGGVCVWLSTRTSAGVLAVWADVVAALKRRDVWLAFLFFVSPVGAAALTNLFSAVAQDFHASPNAVIAVVVLASVLTPSGAVVGGVLCDRYDRWRMYPIAGLISAASAAAMIVAPLASATYIAGAAAYAFATGFAYAAFMALALDLIGTRAAASSTRFTLFMAAVNVPVVYMIRLDGFGHAHFGVRGMLAVDAVSNVAFALLALLWLGAAGTAIRRPERTATADNT
jgi:PAT family beta-lactamase induction signal transducer AmpG